MLLTTEKLVSADCPNSNSRIHFCSRKDSNAVSSDRRTCVCAVVLGGWQARLGELFQPFLKSLSTQKKNFMHRNYFLMKFLCESVLRSELTR